MLQPSVGQRASSQIRDFFESDVTTAASSGSMQSGYAVAFDHDGDGDLDILVCNRFERDQILINDGTGAFTFYDEDKVNEEAGGGSFGMTLTVGTEQTSTRGAVVFDADGDGDGDDCDSCTDVDNDGYGDTSYGAAPAVRGRQRTVGARRAREATAEVPRTAVRARAAGGAGAAAAGGGLS